LRIQRLEISSFPVPFRTVFRHASASRARAENLIVAMHSDSGEVGYGEGCPREYVTGETVDSGAAFIRKHADSIVDGVTDARTLRDWATAQRDDVDQNPAAFSAMEIAALDLLGKTCATPSEELLGLPRLTGRFPYSAVLGESPYPAYWWQFRRYWKRGFRDFKVKVSGNLERDRRKMRLFRNRSDPKLRVRLDANNLWASEDECIRHVAALPHEVYAIEEPLRAGDLAGFERVGVECGVKIILDESLLRAEQLDKLNDPERWIVNLRVSKMGGIMRSLEVARRASGLGIGVIVGAQVGETSILTRAGLTVMHAAQPNLVASEGAFGTHLLRRDLTSESLMFGDDGAVVAERDEIGGGPGLGLEVRSQDLVPL
jgi:L-alanine-DL-glutamate epimerase-like enolase superfamily enzyme